ncbi:MAG: M20 family metallopeptidase [Clostridiales bacterium]|nr:M20 family metallopeptidase [Clostridiales bacterium]
MTDLNNVIEELRESLIDILSRWVSIPSLKADPAPGAPYGLEVKRALEAALADAQKLGFDVRNIDGHAGDVRMGPLDKDPLGILVHLDVVPAGDGWQVDPFGAVLEGDRIYGRGTSDDKGPAVAALLAMYAVKQAGIPLSREVRLILGCDEETGMDDMKYYAAQGLMPRTGFSPDASFPVINTEKGMLQIQLRTPAASDGLPVKSIDVGQRTNVIPGMATALIHGDGLLCAKVNRLAGDMHLQVEAEMAGDSLVRLTSTGISGHAAYPESARNAIGQLLLMLRALGVAGVLKTLADCVGMEYDGSGLGVKCTDALSGPLTCNLGILRYDKDGCFATLDIRYPVLAYHERIVHSLRAALGEDIQVTVAAHKDPHHVPPNSPLVTALLDAYHEETGRDRECISTGGGTYARCLGEGVAFGSAFPEDEELAHQAGEYASIDGLMTNIRIFANAIMKLAGA